MTVDEATRPQSPCCCDNVHLTAREIDILCLLAAGHTSKRAAVALQMSRRTVDAHVTAMLRKAMASSRAELLALAAGHGMIDMTASPPRRTGRACLPRQAPTARRTPRP